MTKQILALMITAGVGLASTVAVAAPPSAGFTGNARVTTAACTLLADAVNVGVSAKVVGAYSCDETLNIVQVASCHEGGSRATGPACGLGAAATASLPPEQRQADVPGCTYGQTPAQANSTIPSYKAFYATSAGGVMQEAALGTRCNTSSIAGISLWK